MGFFWVQPLKTHGLPTLMLSLLPPSYSRVFTPHGDKIGPVLLGLTLKLSALTEALYQQLAARLGQPNSSVINRAKDVLGKHTVVLESVQLLE
jgi:hypothetical protein